MTVWKVPNLALGWNLLFATLSVRHDLLSRLIRPIWINFGVCLSYTNTHGCFLWFFNLNFFSTEYLFFELGDLFIYRHFQVGSIYCCYIHLILVKFGMRLAYTNIHSWFSIWLYFLDYILGFSIYRLGQTAHLATHSVRQAFLLLYPSNLDMKWRWVQVSVSVNIGWNSWYRLTQKFKYWYWLKFWHRLISNMKSYVARICKESSPSVSAWKFFSILLSTK